METMFWIWLGLLVLAVIIEIATLDLVSVWFAVGAIIPLILSGIGGIMIEIQVVVFVVVSALLIIFLRKYAQKWLFKNMNSKTNMDMQIGKVYRLLENADFEKNGSVKINDVVWTAVSEKGQLIEKGQLVEIVKIEGNKMIVKPAKENADKISQDDNSIKNESEENKQISDENSTKIKSENLEGKIKIDSEKADEEKNIKKIEEEQK